MNSLYGFMRGTYDRIGDMFSSDQVCTGAVKQRVEEPVAPEKEDDVLPPGIRLVLISDTHNLHGSVDLPDGDVLLHGGDFSTLGDLEDVKGFTDWFAAQDQYQERVFIAGNHDMTLDTKFYVDRGAARFHPNQTEKSPEDYSKECRKHLKNKNFTYLEDSAKTFSIKSSSGSDKGRGRSSGRQTSCQLRVWGSPISPEFGDWGFNETPDTIGHTWDKIPEGLDILLTHGPPHGLGDGNLIGGFCGCPKLLQKLKSMKDPPRVHLFGHIHESYGAYRGWWDESSGGSKTLFVNASSCTHKYEPTQSAFVVHLPFDKSLPARLLSPNKNRESKEIINPASNKNIRSKSKSKSKEIE